MDFDHIYLIGDMHADFEELVMQSIRKCFIERNRLIILGDVGTNYFGGIRDKMHKDVLSQVSGAILSTVTCLLLRVSQVSRTDKFTAERKRLGSVERFSAELFPE